MNNTLYIFKATSLKDVEMPADMTPINFSMPIHTQIYRFFFPNSFDVSQIRATKNMIDEHGLEHVIKLYIETILNINKIKDFSD